MKNIKESHNYSSFIRLLMLLSGLTMIAISQAARSQTARSQTNNAALPAFLISGEEFIRSYKDDVPVDHILKSVVSLQRKSARGSGIVLGSTADSQALLLTANHNLSYQRNGIELDGVKDASQTEYIVDRFLLRFSPHDGEPKTRMAFPLYAPSPLAERMENIKSSQDFSFALVSGADFDESPTEQELRNKRFGEPKIKPLQVATAATEDTVFAVGFPKSMGDQQMVSVGLVVSDEEAKIILQKSISPFDPQVEFLIHGIGHPGMSGGGVFNTQGSLVGVISRVVRGDYIRVVRIEHIIRASGERARDIPALGTVRETLRSSPEASSKRSCKLVFQ